MPSAAATTRQFCAVAFAIVCGSSAYAQALAQPSPIERLSDVAQFGMPRDAAYVFCDGGDCPDRSIKHLYVEQIVRAEPRYIEEEIELSQAKPKPKQAVKKSPRKRIKKVNRKKQAIKKCRCTHGTAK